MTQGLKALRQAKISNVEDTPGTAEAATEVLIYEDATQMTHDKVFTTPVTDRGLLAEMVETPFQTSQQVEIEMSGFLNTRQNVWPFANAIRGNITPTQPDSSGEPNHYLWTFEPTLTAGNTPDITNGIDTFTLEWGDNIQAYEASFIFTRTLEISATVNEGVRFTWSMTGKNVTETTFTSLTAPTTYEFMAFNQGSWYVDTSYANIGMTQKSGVLYGFTWTLETMFTPRFTADGQLYYSALNEDRKAVELKLQLYRDSTIFEAELDKFQAQTTSYQRIACFGQTEMDSAQSNPPYIYFDGAYKYTEWPELDEQDGAETIEVTARSFYDTTASKAFGVLIGTLLSAYP